MKTLFQQVSVLSLSDMFELKTFDFFQITADAEFTKRFLVKMIHVFVGRLRAIVIVPLRELSGDLTEPHRPLPPEGNAQYVRSPSAIRCESP